MSHYVLPAKKKLLYDRQKSQRDFADPVILLHCSFPYFKSFTLIKLSRPNSPTAFVIASSPMKC